MFLVDVFLVVVFMFCSERTEVFLGISVFTEAFLMISVFCSERIGVPDDFCVLKRKEVFLVISVFCSERTVVFLMISVFCSEKKRGVRGDICVLL